MRYLANLVPELLREQRTVNPPIAPSLQLLLLFLEDVGGAKELGVNFPPFDWAEFWNIALWGPLTQETVSFLKVAGACRWTRMARICAVVCG
jgi:hypothetical protein